ncbi:DUF885 domain-containing protein [Neptunicella sp.]|uniref:DUF885 domain-containing protein n=1 Tax=Neptunicella sp. TaxID=2125986 RepID=UPI003F68D179
MKSTPLACLLTGALVLASCSQPPSTDSTDRLKTDAEQPTVEYSAKQIANESDKANAFFEQVFNQQVSRSPEYQTYLGMKSDNDKWDDNSDENAKRELEFTRQDLETLQNTINYDALDAQTQLSYDLFVEQAERQIRDFKWRFHNYPVNQMFGMQSGTPSFLINFHRVDSVEDAKGYITRLVKVEPRFDNLLTGLKVREDMNIIPPKFVFEHVIRDSNNIIEDTTIIDDFRKKVDDLTDVDDSQRDELVSQAQTAINEHVVPAYQKLVAYLVELEKKADDRDGAWKFRDGAAFYNNALKNYTTTDLTAQQIHQIGLDEVARIHNEMREIMQQVGFEGDLQAFFQFMREDEQFYYPNTDEGRQQYLDEAKALIDVVKGRLDELFLTLPKADMIVKRVEPFREKSAGKAFYNRPAPDGSRPGIYYANLYNMQDMPTYQMRALAYHEGIPGHHMQLAISQELEGIPKFRKYGSYTAYTEGWGLYSEFTPKEMGLYDNPYDDFGRLAMELWRACRLVVDTGIHYKQWTRQQGIDYYVQNTPNPLGDAVKMVERHIVMPGQATAYKIGMLKILQLREKAKKALGDQFDIREYHDVVLKNGPLPLSVLEAQVDKWIASKQA